MERKYRKLLFELADSISLNEDTSIEYLNQHSVDIPFYLNTGLKEIKKKEFLVKAENNLYRHQSLLERAIKLISTAVPETLESIENAIRLKQPAFKFRNLKELDQSQLIELLKDVDLISTIEKLENLDSQDD